ncbi:MAG: hypothetical protein ACJAVK_001168 [Akkermansiaceae bacterium]|jgi:hypothetical protein
MPAPSFSPSKGNTVTARTTSKASSTTLPTTPISPACNSLQTSALKTRPPSPAKTSSSLSPATIPGSHRPLQRPHRAIKRPRPLSRQTAQARPSIQERRPSRPNRLFEDAHCHEVFSLTLSQEGGNRRNSFLILPLADNHTALPVVPLDALFQTSIIAKNEIPEFPVFAIFKRSSITGVAYCLRTCPSTVPLRDHARGKNFRSPEK